MRNQHNYTYNSNFEREQKALQWAKDKLLAQGVLYPLPDSSKPNEENYEALRAYADKEAKLFHEYFQQQHPSPAKPSENKQHRDNWGNWNDK